MNIKILATLLVLAADSLQAANLLRVPSVPQVKEPKTGSSWDLLKNVVKKPMKRRVCEVNSLSMAFPSLGVLKSDKAYEIKIFRGRKDTRTLFFSKGADNFSLQSGEKWKLIQAASLSNPTKNLCIAAASDLHGKINNDVLHQFTLDIIAANGNLDVQQNAFREYKTKIGLPGLGRDFAYNIYAWETVYDCALYNLGVPEAYYPDTRGLKKTKSDMFSHTSEYFARTYAIQVSKINVNHNPVSIFQMKTDRNYQSSLRLQPFGYFYRSFDELSQEFDQAEIETLTFGANDEKCAAFFYQTESKNVSRSADQVEKYLNIYNKQGILGLRVGKFLEDFEFSKFLGNFNLSDSVTCAMWQKRNGKCGWLRMDSDNDEDNFDDLTERDSASSYNDSFDDEGFNATKEVDSDDNSDYEEEVGSQNGVTLGDDFTDRDSTGSCGDSFNYKGPNATRNRDSDSDDEEEVDSDDE